MITEMKTCFILCLLCSIQNIPNDTQLRSAVTVKAAQYHNEVTLKCYTQVLELGCEPRTFCFRCENYTNWARVYITGKDTEYWSNSAGQAASLESMDGLGSFFILIVMGSGEVSWKRGGGQDTALQVIGGYRWGGGLNTPIKILTQGWMLTNHVSRNVQMLHSLRQGRSYWILI